MNARRRSILFFFVAMSGCRPHAASNPAPVTPPRATAAADPKSAPAEPEDPNRPQTPRAPFPYDAHDVEYTNAASGLTLAGTLTTPHGEGKSPAVVLISGSGPQDRDSTVFGHKPFWLFADTLGRHGIAVLRVDDRGVGGSAPGSDDVTSADFATDVAAGIAFLRTRPEIDAARIALVGHSEGGMIAPMVAASDPTVAAVVLLAAPGLPGREVLRAQTEAVLNARGLPEAVVDAAVAQQTKVLAAMVEAPDLPSAREAVLETVGADNPAARSLVEKQVIPWMLYFIKHDPGPVLEQVHCPVLAMAGTLDLQVSAEANLPKIAAALARGGNKRVKTVELKGLNHLFQPAQTGEPSEYEHIKTTFDPEALTQVVRWLQRELNVTGARTNP